MPNTAGNTSALYPKRDELILRLAAALRLILPAVVSVLYFARRPGGHVLKRLADAGLLEAHNRILPGGFSVFAITPAGCSAIGINREKAGLPQGAMLDLAVALNFFCALGSNRRFLLDGKKREALGLEVPPNVPCVMSEELGKAQTFRVYHAASSDIAKSVKAVKDIAEQMRNDKALRAWATDTDLGIAVLVPTVAKRDALKRALEKQELSRELPLLVELGPTAATLSAAFKKKGS